MPVAEHDLGVRADIDDQRHFIAKVRFFREDHPRGIRAHMPGDARQHIDAGVLVDGVEAHFGRPYRHSGTGCKRERCAAEFDRVNPQEQVMHDRVADNRHVENGMVFLTPHESVRLTRKQLGNYIGTRIRSAQTPKSFQIFEEKVAKLVKIGKKLTVPTTISTEFPPCIKHAIDVLNNIVVKDISKVLGMMERDKQIRSIIIRSIIIIFLSCYFIHQI